ncbi:MAG TPA: peptidase M17, partial [Cytophagaceae bacterium]
MLPDVKLVQQTPENDNLVLIVKDQEAVKTLFNGKEGTNAFVNSLNSDKKFVHLNTGEKSIFIVLANENDKNEALRKKGFDVFTLATKDKLSSLHIHSKLPASLTLAFAEGLLLSGYQFLKYKTKPEAHSLNSVTIQATELSRQAVDELLKTSSAVFAAKDLVNEPVNFLTAETLSEELIKYGKKAGFEVEVFNKTKIQSLKMGGLLSVNLGSPNPPTFNILEYKPANA